LETGTALDPQEKSISSTRKELVEEANRSSLDIVCISSTKRRGSS